MAIDRSRHLDKRRGVGKHGENPGVQQGSSEKDDRPSAANSQEEDPLDVLQSTDQTDTGDGSDNALSRRDRNAKERSKHDEQRGGQLGRGSTRRREHTDLVPNRLDNLVSVKEETKSKSDTSISKNPLLDGVFSCESAALVDENAGTQRSNGVTIGWRQRDK